jgi:hypothetical protein
MLMVEENWSGKRAVRRFASNSRQGFDVNGWGKIGAGNEVRTRDLNLGKVALYQLSYSRVTRSLALKAGGLKCTSVASPRGVEPLLPG